MLLQKMTFSAWLLVEISFVHIKLTSWQSCHPRFSSYEIGTKQMLLDFFLTLNLFGHSIFKGKEGSLVNPSHPAAGMLVYLSKPITWIICKYIPKDAVAKREANWRFFQNSGRRLSWRIAVCIYLSTTYQRW